MRGRIASDVETVLGGMQDCASDTYNWQSVASRYTMATLISEDLLRLRLVCFFGDAALLFYRPEANRGTTVRKSVASDIVVCNCL